MNWTEHIMFILQFNGFNLFEIKQRGMPCISSKKSSSKIPRIKDHSMIPKWVSWRILAPLAFELTQASQFHSL